MGGCLFALITTTASGIVGATAAFFLFRVTVTEQAPLAAILLGVAMGLVGSIMFFRVILSPPSVPTRRAVPILPDGWQWVAVVIGGPICARLLRSLLPPLWYQAVLIGLAVFLLPMMIYFFIISVHGGWLSLTDA